MFDFVVIEDTGGALGVVLHSHYEDIGEGVYLYTMSFYDGELVGESQTDYKFPVRVTSMNVSYNVL